MQQNILMQIENLSKTYQIGKVILSPDEKLIEGTKIK
jgi:hypothetical protein